MMTAFCSGPTLRTAAARAEDEYAGVRIDFVAELAGARLPMHVDIGYGDAITPGAMEIEYPALLGQPTAHLRAYPPETVVAEKFQAMVALGMLNTRLKDFYGIWAIAGSFAFDGAVLSRALQATFDRRQTPLPVEPPRRSRPPSLTRNRRNGPRSYGEPKSRWRPNRSRRSTRKSRRW
jgi:hypothetical protein